MSRFNNTLLKNKIMQSYESIAAFCEAAGIENAPEFEQELDAGDIQAQSIIKAAEALQLLPEEIGFYFFAPDPKTSTDTTPEDLAHMYEQLTPENKAKFMNKYAELLRAQQAEA